MRKMAICGELRTQRGKGAARQLRGTDKIPGIIYSAGASTPLSLDPKELGKLLHAGGNTLITLNIQGEEGSRLAILRDVQRDPIHGKILHADLFEISMNTPIVVKVSVEVVGGTPLGVKEGGSLQHNLRELEIRCLPSVIPDHIQIDASPLKIGQAVHVKEIPLDAGIEMMTDKEQVAVSVIAPITEAKLEALLATAPKETKEPEVLTKKESEEPEKGEGKVEAKEAKGKEEKPKK